MSSRSFLPPTYDANPAVLPAQAASTHVARPGAARRTVRQERRTPPIGDPGRIE